MAENLVENGETDGNSASTSLEVVAELIHTLDNAFAQVSSFAASAAVETEDARRNALTASEFVKLCTPKDY